MAIHLNILFGKYKERGCDIIAVKLKTSEALYRLQNPASEKKACSFSNQKYVFQYM